MIKCIVYTAIIGGYDTLKEPSVPQPDGLEFVCLTDDPALKSTFWDVRLIDISNIDNTRKARFLKLHPHLFFPTNRFSIWLDGSLSIVGNILKLYKEVTNNSKLGVYSHAKRDCIYKAAENCIEKNKDDKIVIEEQMSSYKLQGYPENNGLVASGVLVRDHLSKEIIELMEDWWKQIENHSKRDQLSFNFVCWRMKFKYFAIPKRIGDGRYFRRNPHLLSSN